MRALRAVTPAHRRPTHVGTPLPGVLTSGGHETLSSPAPAELLPPLLLRGEGVVPVLVHQGDVAGHHGGGAAPDEAEGLLLAGGVQVVEEDAPDAARLPAVADVEVAVTPGEGGGKTLWDRKHAEH